MWRFWCGDIRKMQKIGFVFLFSMLVLGPARAQTIIGAPPNNLNVIVWAGQSNAAGRGPIGFQNIVGGEHQFMLTLGGKWVAPAFEPSHTTESQWGGSLYPSVLQAGTRGGFGASVSFLNEMVRLNPASNFALVNIAVSGTHIQQHLPSGPIYQMGRSQILKTAAYGTISAFVWIQGEADASYHYRAAMWAKNFETIVSAWRAEFGATIPVIIVQLGDPVMPGTKPFWGVVQRQQLRVCETIGRCAIVSTIGLKKQYVNGVEALHYTNTSYRTIGQEMARTLYTLQH